MTVDNDNMHVADTDDDWFTITTEQLNSESTEHILNLTTYKIFATDDKFDAASVRVTPMISRVIHDINMEFDRRASSKTLTCILHIGAASFYNRIGDKSKELREKILKNSKRKIRYDITGGCITDEIISTAKYSTPAIVFRTLYSETIKRNDTDVVLKYSATGYIRETFDLFKMLEFHDKWTAIFLVLLGVSQLSDYMNRDEDLEVFIHKVVDPTIECINNLDVS